MLMPIRIVAGGEVMRPPLFSVSSVLKFLNFARLENLRSFNAEDTEKRGERGRKTKRVRRSTIAARPDLSFCFSLSFFVFLRLAPLFSASSVLKLFSGELSLSG